MAYLKNKLCASCLEFFMYKPTTAVWQPSASILFKITLLGSAIAALGMTTGCSSTPANSKTIKSNQVGSGLLDASSLDSLEDLLSATDMRAVEGDRLLILKHGDVWKRMTVGFKMDLNHWDSRIEAQRSWFISRQPYLDRLSARASRYLYHTVKEAERRGLPTELALLPVIESSYDPAATSSAAAAGLWQFIPSTGKIYGLKQTSLYDGRRDVVESTRAAYEFLSSLYNQFGSWELALAAYNAGPGRIQQAINRNRAAGLPTDYWSLKLPQETMNYVPRFLAVAQIIKNPSAYGVSLPPIANRPHFREVNLNGGVGLNQVSSITGLSRAELYALNPGHRGEYVDPASPMRILIPADLSPAIDTKLRSLNSGSGGLWASNQPPVASKPASSVRVQTRVTPAASATVPSSSLSSAPMLASNSSKTTTAKVSTPKGSDALASFAAKADIPSAPRIPVAVTPAANITPVRVEPPISQTERDQILALVKAEGEKKSVEEVLQPQASQAEKDEVVAELKALAPQGTEIVDPYDGKIKLTAIQTSLSVAEQQGKEVKRGFSYPKAVAENTLANSEELERNKGKDYIKTDSEIVVIPPKGKRSTYTVQPGDTLAVIAMKNGVSWRDVAKWNQIDPSATLYVGTSLYLYDPNPQKVEEKTVKASKPETYLVKANDSLTSVADQFGLSLKQLADWNNLSVTSGLFVGQKLQLKDNPNAAVAKPVKVADTRVTAEQRIKTKSYTVKRGEYLKMIAERYALSNQELADLTPGLTSTSSLLVGQRINVPVEETSVSAKVETKEDKKTTLNDNIKVSTNYKTESYKVQRGDTLTSIAAQSKVSVSELAQLNNINTGSGVRIGQTLKVPAGASMPDEYIVQPGDTLTSVAGKYHLQVNFLAGLNGLNRNSGLRVGQKIKLDGELPVSPVPVEKETVTVKNSKNNSSGSHRDTERYTVKNGESLNTIASRVGISVKELAELNNLESRAGLLRGQNLLIPKTVTSYTVKRGDTLIGLANKYGMNTSELAEMNNIQPSTQLRIGEVIKVPNL